MAERIDTGNGPADDACAGDGRRAFFRAFIAAAATGTVAAALAGPAEAQATVSDADILNFALNLEYLEGNFYSFVLTGQPLGTGDTSGTGTAGAATGGRQVTFTDPAVAALAREIGANERSHVQFLRTQLGGAAIAQPAIDLAVTPTSAFSMAARSAGLIGANQSFDPYANDVNFLMAAFLFEEVGVTAYKGAARLVQNKTYLEAAAGILATEAYQASSIRTMLYTKGIQTPAIIDMTEAISNARDTLDNAIDDDQGIRPIGTMSNIAPTDANGIVFGRSTGDVLNIAYLNPGAVSRGGFFPNGVNGTITTSSAG